MIEFQRVNNDLAPHRGNLPEDQRTSELMAEYADPKTNDEPQGPLPAKTPTAMQEEKK